MTPTYEPDRALRVRAVTAKTGLSRASIWRLSRAGAFPKPFKISEAATAWSSREIDTWLARRMAARSPTQEAPSVARRNAR